MHSNLKLLPPPRSESWRSTIGVGKTERESLVEERRSGARRSSVVAVGARHQ